MIALRRVLLVALLSIPAQEAVAGGSSPDTLEGAAPYCAPMERRHTHDVRVNVDEAPITDGVHVHVDDHYAGVHIEVNIEVHVDEDACCDSMP